MESLVKRTLTLPVAFDCLIGYAIIIYALIKPLTATNLAEVCVLALILHTVTTTLAFMIIVWPKIVHTDPINIMCMCAAGMLVAFNWILFAWLLTIPGFSDTAFLYQQVVLAILTTVVLMPVILTIRIELDFANVVRVQHHQPQSPRETTIVVDHENEYEPSVPSA